MKKIIKFVTLFVSLTIIALLFLISTNAGLNVSLVVLEKVLPGQLKVTHADGRLIDHFKLQGLSYRDQDMQLANTDIELNWRAISLLKGELVIKSLQADNIKLKILDNDSSNTFDETLLQTPIPFTILKLKVQQLIIDVDGNSYLFNYINAKVTANKRKATLNHLEFSTLGQAIKLHGFHQLTAPFKADFKAEVKPQLQSKHALHANINILGGSLKYKLESHWQSPMKANIKASIDFSHAQQKVAWQFDTHVAELNLAAFVPEINSRLNFHFTQSGLFQHDSIHQTSRISDIEGIYNHQSLQGDLYIESTGKKLDHLTAKLNLGPNSLQIKNVDSSGKNIEWQLSIDSLSQVLPSIAGSIRASGKMFIDPIAPSINGNLKAHAIKVSQLRLPKVDVGFILGKKLNVNMRVSQARWQDYQLDLIKLTLAGSPSKAQLKATLSVKDNTSLSLEASVKQLKNRWQLEFKNILAKIGTNNVWRLKAPSPLSIDKKIVSLSPLCLTQASDKLCIDGRWNRAQNTLSARLGLNLSALDFIDEIVDEIENTRGQLKAKLKLTGPLDNLNYQGNLKLKAGKTTLKDLGLTLDAISADLTTKQQIWQLKAQAQTPKDKGTLSLTGHGSLQDDTLDATLHLKGHSLVLTNQQQYQIKLNPDITVTSKNNHVNIQGTVNIPYARIHGYDFSDTVTLPRDVVFIDKATSPPSKVKYDAKVKIQLGDDIKLSVMGLGGDVTGALILYDSDDEATTATGSLQIEKGEFKAYGQYLKINRGQLIYAGGPIDNPSIDLQASREITSTGTANLLSNFTTMGSTSSSDKVTVGINVNGYLQTPKIKLFSIPANLSQADILSYLVLGRSSDSVSDADGQLLVNALGSLDLGRGEKQRLVGQLNHTLGIKVGLGTQSTYDSDSKTYSDQTAVVISKALSPKLFLSYSIGLIEGTSLFKIKYLINKYWSIQTESGDDINGVDLYYTYVSHA